MEFGDNIPSHRSTQFSPGAAEAEKAWGFKTPEDWPALMAAADQLRVTHVVVHHCIYTATLAGWIPRQKNVISTKRKYGLLISSKYAMISQTWMCCGRILITELSVFVFDTLTDRIEVFDVTLWEKKTFSGPHIFGLMDLQDIWVWWRFTRKLKLWTLSKHFGMRYKSDKRDRLPRL